MEDTLVIHDDDVIANKEEETTVPVVVGVRTDIPIGDMVKDDGETFWAMGATCEEEDEGLAL